MAANPLNALKRGEWSYHRKALTAADPTDYSQLDKAYIFNCEGYSSILVTVKFTGGTAPAVTLEPLLYDQEDQEFRPLHTVDVMANDAVHVIRVYGGRAFLRVDGVVGSPTSFDIKVMPGEPYPAALL